MIKKQTALIFGISIFITIPIFSQNSTNRIFEKDDPIKVSMLIDYEELMDYDEDSTVYRDAVLRVNNKDIKIELAVRGNFRLAFCHFPPLWVRFPDESNSGTEFENIDRFKMVTHCAKDPLKYQPAVLHEYIVYKMYNMIDDNSFQVRLLDVEFRDVHHQDFKINALAFMLEDTRNLAARVNAEYIDDAYKYKAVKKIKPSLQLSVFQYFVGNNDWVLPAHNVKMYVVPTNDTIAIPYDFDLSYLPGSYFFPMEERKYQGICPEMEELKETLDFYRKNESKLNSLITENPYFSKDVIDESIQYYKSFFDQIRTDEQFMNEIKSSCK